MSTADAQEQHHCYQFHHCPVCFRIVPPHRSSPRAHLPAMLSQIHTHRMKPPLCQGNSRRRPVAAQPSMHEVPRYLQGISQRAHPSPPLPYRYLPLVTYDSVRQRQRWGWGHLFRSENHPWKFSLSAQHKTRPLTPIRFVVAPLHPYRWTGPRGRVMPLSRSRSTRRPSARSGRVQGVQWPGQYWLHGAVPAHPRPRLPTVSVATPALPHPPL